MDLRLALAALLSLGVLLPAQIETKPQPQPQTQDPDKPKPTAAEETKQLNSEKERLQREIGYVKEQATKGKGQLAARLAPKKMDFKSIDAGQSKAMMPPPVTAPMTPRAAIVASEDQLAAFPNDTMLIVQGRPIARGRFDTLMAFLKETESSGDDSMRAQRALFDLIRTEAVVASFDENEAGERLGDVHSQLDAGKTFAELVTAFGAVPGAGPEGTVEVTRNSMFGPIFEHAAFTTEVGKRTHFRNANGIVVLKVDKMEKGATPDLDKVIASAVQITHGSDADALAKALQSVNMAQIEVICRDKAVLDMLPATWKPMPEAPQVSPVVDTAPVVRGATEELKKQLEALQEQIQKLSTATDEESKKRLPVLQQAYKQLKTQITAAEGGARVEKTEPEIKREAPVKKL